MKSFAGLVTAAALAAAVGGCASETYAPRSNYSHGYYTPGYAYSAPRYRTTTYSYSAPQGYSERRAYDGYWDYQRNYRGIHASPEFSSM